MNMSRKTAGAVLGVTLFVGSLIGGGSGLFAQGPDVTPPAATSESKADQVQEPSYTGSTSVDEAQYEGMSEADEAAQAQQIAQVLAAEARYVDPRTAEPLIGPAAVAGYVAQFTKMAPGAVAEVAQIDERDGVARATIAFVMPDGARQMGQYFIRASSAGSLEYLVGFVGTGA